MKVKYIYESLYPHGDFVYIYMHRHTVRDCPAEPDRSVINNERSFRQI